MAARSMTVSVLTVLVAAALAGFLLRWVGAVEGLRPTGGILPIVASSLLCLGLWLALWKASQAVYPPLRLALAALVPFLIGGTAGVIWASYGVVPGAALAVLAVVLALAVRR